MWQTGLVEALQPLGVECLNLELVGSRWSELQSIRSVLSKLQTCDIVHLSTLNRAIGLVGAWSAVRGPPIVLTVHGDFLREAPNKPMHVRPLFVGSYVVTLHLAHGATFPSEYLRRRLSHVTRRHLPVNVIPNGISTQRLSKVRPYTRTDLDLEDSSIVLIESTSFNQYEKCAGLIPLCGAFSRLLREHDDAVLLVLGAGRYLERFRSRLENSTIRFLGHREDALRLVKTADLFVHSTFLDNFPYSVLEAMALSLPIVATDVGGIREMAERAATLVPPCEDSLFQAMKNLVKDDEKRDRMARRSREAALEYEWNQVARRFLAFYESLLNSKTRTPGLTYGTSMDSRETK